MHNTALGRETSLSDLGLVVDSKVNWSNHTTKIINRPNQYLGLAKCTIGHNISNPVKLQCYKTLIQPLLEYATQIWSNSSCKDIKKIESVQRRATKYILKDNNMTLITKLGLHLVI